VDLCSQLGAGFSSQGGLGLLLKSDNQGGNGAGQPSQKGQEQDQENRANAFVNDGKGRENDAEDDAKNKIHEGSSLFSTGLLWNIQ
jgi:hypothetical protein